jgi:hypothetical protein
MKFFNNTDGEVIIHNERPVTTGDKREIISEVHAERISDAKTKD